MIDPLYPILITQEATRQGWFPEWFVTGTGLTDTTTAGRLYDQLQWRHAFGISPLWVTWKTAARSGGHRAFHHGAPSQDIKAGGVLIDIYATFVGTMFNGIHMAGPNLTPDNFAQRDVQLPEDRREAAAPARLLDARVPDRRRRTSPRSGTTRTAGGRTNAVKRGPG